MTSDTQPAIRPIAHGPQEGEATWFLGALVIAKADTVSTGGRVAVLEHRAPRGAGSPLHIHRREDEWFYVLEGQLTFWVDGDLIVADAGTFVYGPRSIPHTFSVSSDEAHFLLVTEPAGFDAFVREVGMPAERRQIPPPTSAPPDVERLTRIAAGYGIEIIGPPGIPA